MANTIAKKPIGKAQVPAKAGMKPIADKYAQLKKANVPADVIKQISEASRQPALASVNLPRKYMEVLALDKIKAIKGAEKYILALEELRIKIAKENLKPKAKYIVHVLPGKIRIKDSDGNPLAKPSASYPAVVMVNNVPVAGSVLARGEFASLEMPTMEKIKAVFVKNNQGNDFFALEVAEETEIEVMDSSKDKPLATLIREGWDIVPLASLSVEDSVSRNSLCSEVLVVDNAESTSEAGNKTVYFTDKSLPFGLSKSIYFAEGGDFFTNGSRVFAFYNPWQNDEGSLMLAGVCMIPIEAESLSSLEEEMPDEEEGEEEPIADDDYAETTAEEIPEEELEPADDEIAEDEDEDVLPDDGEEISEDVEEEEEPVAAPVRRKPVKKPGVPRRH